VRLLDVLAMVSFRAGKTKESLLEDGITAIPECQRKTETTFSVGDTEQPVLTPAIGPASGVIVREIVPARSSRGIVLSHRSPLPLREVRSPALPVLLTA